MPHANDVQFLKVRGVIVIGDVPLPYKFMLVKYDLSIDGIPWVIFSNLNDALYREFKEGFFRTLNVDRKDRWGFEQVAWLDGPGAYDVDFPYSDTWLSIFEPSGATSREVRPFVYNDDHLRVHRNGAAVYSEEKKLIFLLPLIVHAHHLLPDIPIFWANDNSPLSLYKSYTWMHEDTIKWLADTGADYPPALRPQIQPRIDALRAWQSGRRQPPQPPRPNRWQEKNTQGWDDTEARAPPAAQAQAVRLSPRHMVKDDKMYMIMQEGFLDIANTLPIPKRSLGNQARASQVENAESSPESPSQKPPATTDKGEKRGKTKATRAEAGKMATRRPATPPPKADARKTDKLSKRSPSKEVPKEKEQAQESSSSDSSSSSSSSSEAPEAPHQPEEEETQEEEEEEEEQSSEESDMPDLTDKAIKKADLPTLNKMQRAAEKRIGALESDLKTTKDFLTVIIKRRKVVQKESRDADMERMD